VARHTGPVRNDPHDIEPLLTGTSLAGLPLGHGPGGSVLIQGVPPAGLLAAWQEAYALLPATGRYPLLVTDWGGELRMLSEPGAGPTAERLAELDRAARTVDPWTAHLAAESRLVPKENAGGFASGYRGLDLTAEVQRKLKYPITQQELGRWIYKRVLTDPDMRTQVVSGVSDVVQTGHWYTPDNVSLLLLPTDLPWLAGFWASYHGATGSPEETAAVLWQWHDSWDARLVASWGTMLQFIVHRPPTAGIEAWTVAGQILSLARSEELQRWELAMVLPDGNAWFLHDRP
jgi:uncharacterized protein DUF4253